MYYLSWLRNRILHNDPEVEKKQGWVTVGELEGCVHYKVGKDMLLYYTYIEYCTKQYCTLLHPIKPFYVIIFLKYMFDYVC